MKRLNRRQGSLFVGLAATGLSLMLSFNAQAGESSAASSVASSGASSGASSTNVDDQARELLIQKLTGIKATIATSDSAYTALTLRLADLHAERARVNSMNELSSGCTVCNAGKDDRVKALGYYQEVVGKVGESSRGKVLTQIGHLYEMTGNEAKAISTYEAILKEEKNPAALAEAHLSLGEVFFKRRSYAPARAQFQAVMNEPQASSRGLAAYRIAWCEFNEGQLQSAIDGLISILKTPSLLNRGSGAEVVQVDKQFQEEVSHDLATFVARRGATLHDGEVVYELSPDSAKLGHISYLAGEAERLGQIQPALQLWRFSQEHQTNPQAKLEGFVRLAQLEMEQKLLTEAIRDFDLALALWPQTPACSNGDGCKELKLRMRKLVTDWNRAEKKTPTEALLSAYRDYLKVFPTEADMTIWSAKVASDLKQYPLAVDLYLTAAKLNSDNLEPGLLGAIESAELAKDNGLLNTAYDSYLKMSKVRSKALEVQYQKAHLLYDKGDNAAAADALREVALSTEGGKGPEAAKVRRQAADLSLDTLVLLKDDKRLESWSDEYAKAFPSGASEFAAISRKSVLTQSTAAAAKGEAGYAEAWATLAKFDASGASQEEKTTYLKNKLVLAEKMHRFADARQASEDLLRQPNLTVADRQYALSRKAWLAELVLDFGTALDATEKLSGTEIKNDQKMLKLAMFAELAMKDPKPFYSQFLKESKDEEKNAAIAAQLVRESKEPLKEIEKNRVALSKRPELLADLYLDVYATTGSLDLAKKSLKVPKVPETAAGKVLARAVLLDEFAKFKTKITAHQLDGSTQKKLSQTLKTRVALLDESEKFATRAIASGDWTSQLVTLDLVAKQSDRFYQDLLSLPVPAGLTGEDEQQYLSLLSQQAAPHKTRATDVGKKVSEFWADDKAIAQLDESLKQETGARHALLVKEVKLVAETAPDARKTQLTAMIERPVGTTLAAGEARPTLAALEGARQAVRETPLNRANLEKLLVLEKQNGSSPMVAYLERRIQSTSESPKEKD